MDKLLKWSIENSQNGVASGNTESRQAAPDPEVLAQLFGAPDDSTLMKEAMVVIENPEATEEAKVIAFDNLEMLVENMDNANNLENMKLWTPLLKQLKSSSSELRKMACWVIGTAVQNNPKAQASLIAYRSAIPDLLQIAADDSSSEVKLKAIYALSSVVRNHQPSYESFKDSDGWDILITIIRQNAHSSVDASANAVRARSIHLLGSVMSTEPLSEKIELLRNLSAMPSLMHVLNADDSYAAIERVIQILLTIAKSDSGLTSDEKAEIKQGIERAKRDGLLEEDPNQDSEVISEWKELEKAISM
ncbi:armadillo-type protein [Dipodascopsis tothii]|uniref:armadillo-type protein n=1 Tax=Dipodascopsis tothii TaxID=44089 RepID=UPI0034CD2E8F